MTLQILKYTVRFILFVLLQGVVLNNIRFFGYVNPYIYIIFLITLPSGIRQELVMLIGFLLGLSIDIFSDTFGIHAFATVFAAFVRHYLLRAYMPRDDRTEVIPSITAFGLGAFFRYSSFMILIHHTVLFAVDYFSVASLNVVAIRILLSSVFTLVLLMGVEKFKTR